jgi:AcrR family transcriptional regulator
VATEVRIAEIREAAIRVFVRKGIDSARMQDIAAEVGLTAGALYRYFPSKAELTRSVFAACEEENREIFEQARAGRGSPLEAILETGRAAWCAFDQPSSRDLLILGLEATLAHTRDTAGLDEPDPIEHTAAVLDRLETLVQQAQAGGELAPDVDARALATLLLSVHQGLGLMLVAANTGTPIEPDAVLEVLTRLLLAIGTGRN